MYTGNMKSERKTREKITIHKIAGHLRTVREHRALVRKYCFAVGLYRQGLTHDLSKYTPTELINGFRYYEEGKRSPNNREREEKGYSDAWMHHKGRNKHHYEYWNDYRMKPDRSKFPVRAVEMPRKYVAEMVCDRMAASGTYLKNNYTQHEPLKYYQKGRARDLMHPQTARELEGMLRILDQKGEKELFRFIRDYYLKGYKV